MFSHPRYRPSLLSGHFKDLHAAPQRKSKRERKKERPDLGKNGMVYRERRKNRPFSYSAKEPGSSVIFVHFYTRDSADAAGYGRVRS